MTGPNLRVVISRFSSETKHIQVNLLGFDHSQIEPKSDCVVDKVVLVHIPSLVAIGVATLELVIGIHLQIHERGNVGTQHRCAKASINSLIK